MSESETGDAPGAGRCHVPTRPVGGIAPAGRPGRPALNRALDIPRVRIKSQVNLD